MNNARKGRFSPAKALGILFLTGATVGLALFGLVCWRATVPREAADADCVIVLGARVWPDGRMSRVLKTRVDAALDAWRAGKTQNIIVCGAQGRDEPRTEADAMAEYLLEQGVPEESIFLDDASYDTRENIANAKAIMDENNWQNAMIATSDYHVERALWMAADAGIPATGLSAPTPKTFRAFWLGRMRETVSWVLYWIRMI